MTKTQFFSNMSLVQLLLTLIGITGLSFGILNVDKSQFQKYQISPESLLPSTKPSIVDKLSPRGERYFIGSKTYPLFREAAFDPIDVKIGETQKVFVRVENPQPLKSVYVLFSTDNQTTRYELKLTEGDAFNGVWSGSWKIEGATRRIYTFTFYAVSEDNKSSSIDYSFGKEFPKR